MSASVGPLRSVDRRLERPDAAEDEHVTAAGHVARLARDLGRLAVQCARLIGQAELGQAQPVRAERVRLDRVRAGRDVLAMDRADQVRLRLDQRVERRPLRHAAREEQRAHRAVEQQRRTRQPLGKCLPRM